MAKKIVENITGEDIELVDIGITVPAGGIYDLLSRRKEVIINSKDLLQNIATGNLVVQKDPLADPIEYYTTVDAIHALYDFYESMPKSQDEFKLAVHQSAKPSRKDSPHGYNTHWAGAGDDPVNHVLGGGPLAQLSMIPGNATETLDIEFDPLFGRIFILHGYVGYHGAGLGDSFSVTAVAKATPLQQFVDLDLELDGDKIRLAEGGPGTGTHGFGGIPTLVPNLISAGWWNYSDIYGLTPSLDQTGTFDIYQVEVDVDRFMNRIPVYGDNHVTASLEAADYSELAPGYLLRIKAYNNSNTNWVLWFFLECYRERSVDANF